MQTLRIVTTDFGVAGEIAGYTSLRLVRRHYGIGEFELHLPISAPGAGEIAIDRMLIPTGAPHKAMLIDRITYEESKGELTARGHTLDGITKRHLAVPPPSADDSFGWDRIIADAETVFKHYAANNLTDPPNAVRRIGEMIIAPNLHRGMAEVPWEARFKQLSALLEELAEYTDMGWSITPDFAQKKLIFDVQLGRDLAVGNPGETHVVISMEARNAAEIKHTVDASGAYNVAYVGGQGEDEQRLILAVDRSEDGQPTPSGIGRRETWVDGGSLELPDELINAGKRKLKDTPVQNTLECKALWQGAFRYERDYDLGDRVTIQGATGTQHARIIEVKETYETGKAPELDLTFGVAPVTLVRKIKELINTTVR